jgi:hypothetical protein
MVCKESVENLSRGLAGLGGRWSEQRDRRRVQMLRQEIQRLQSEVGARRLNLREVALRQAAQPTQAALGYFELCSCSADVLTDYHVQWAHAGFRQAIGVVLTPSSPLLLRSSLPLRRRAHAYAPLAAAIAGSRCMFLIFLPYGPEPVQPERTVGRVIGTMLTLPSLISMLPSSRQLSTAKIQVLLDSQISPRICVRFQ